MTKGDETRERIIMRVAPLFNQQGYYGSSLSDMMAATGLKKGGIYNHFASKDELALAAFEYNWGLLRDKYEQALHSAGDSPAAQLFAAVEVHASFADNPPTAGGCPLLNTAIESDDTHPLLQQHARAAMDYWRSLLTDIVARGIAQGEFKLSTNGEEVATILISTIEGAIMLSKLYNSPDFIRVAATYLREYIRSNVRA
jgi:TetR/AcrR family transcriptional regulator, transcriptional repressor for nem operon